MKTDYRQIGPIHLFESKKGYIEKQAPSQLYANGIKKVSLEKLLLTRPELQPFEVNTNPHNDLIYRYN
jgi:hypothetical protein